MKLVFTHEAQRQAKEMDTWWREHRPKARGLFAQELDETRRLILSSPSIGSKYMTRRGAVAQRVLMPKTKSHVYFEVDEAQGLIIVLAIWGAPRGRGPLL